MESDLDLSIVIPVYNERENIDDLISRIDQAVNPLNKSYEILIVDDGSSDGTWEQLMLNKKKYEHLKLVRFRRNFGQTAAMQAGFDHARGEIIVTMDGDLQNEPEDIGLLLNKMDEGFDIVSGWRYPRKDPFLKRRLPSIIANKIISLATHVKLRDSGCSLKAFRADIVKQLDLYGEMHRFIPALAHWMGVSVSEVKVRHHSRVRGKSKYGLSRTFRVILDLITVKFLLAYSTKPIQIFGLVGLISGGFGIIFGLYLSYVRFILAQPIGGRPLLLMTVLLIFMGIQFVTMGLLAEIQIRTYHESQQKPIYVIKELVD